jgi:hypothetical protein
MSALTVNLPGNLLQKTCSAAAQSAQAVSLVVLEW